MHHLLPFAAMDGSGYKESPKQFIASMMPISLATIFILLSVSYNQLLDIEPENAGNLTAVR
jgi:hypothetical protein